MVCAYNYTRPRCKSKLGSTFFLKRDVGTLFSQKSLHPYIFPAYNSTVSSVRLHSPGAIMGAYTFGITVTILYLDLTEVTTIKRYPQSLL